VPRRVWLRFSSFENWKDKEQAVLRTVAEHGGRDQVVIYIEDRKVKKTLPPGQGIRADDTVIGLLGGICGTRNVVLQ
jgi:DNA polymerase-3 subunit alpha